MKTFIEIGSCDFDTNLKLIEGGAWKGVMVEPAKKFRENLENIAKDIDNRENLSIEAVAISDFDGETEFTEVMDTSSGSRQTGIWRRGISSITDVHHKGERILELEDNSNFIDSVYSVECITLDTLIKKHEITEIDYLKLDVEGHETNILDAYSWSIFPTFIKLEHAHIDDIYARELLESHGYIVYVESDDIYAIK